MQFFISLRIFSSATINKEICISRKAMDSGNSGSMQSSSGGDDQELDSRGESISSFVNAPPPPPHRHNFGSAAPPFLSHQNPNFFDPQNLDPYTNQNDLIWSRPHASSSSSTPPFPDQPPPPSNVVKNPKKRTRASRRAPTTVLTTDTTNFRQMVQEFTGIPAAPFSGSPYARRLDLFSALRSGPHLDPLYPLRPHKLLSPFSSSPAPPLLNSAMIDAMGNSNSNLGASTSNNPNSYQLSGEHHLLGAHQNMNLANLSGFLSRDAGVQVRSNDDDLSRWKSGETVRNNDGIPENMVEFDGNNIHSGESQNYNLNLAQKGMEHNIASTAAQGTVASWICPSE